MSFEPEVFVEKFRNEVKVFKGSACFPSIAAGSVGYLDLFALPCRLFEADGVELI